MPLLSLSLSQLLLAFVSASILRKLTYNRFFLKWLASHRFVCYLVPTNQELKICSDKVKSNQVSKKSARLKNRPIIDPREVFKIPTSSLDSLKLDKTVMTKRDFEIINSSLDLEWIMDLALMSLFSFIITEMQFYFFPLSTEFNFSLLWTLLVIGFCINVLWKLTAVYFKNRDFEFISERSICIISGGIFLLIAMLILTVDENQLELGIESAYRSFNHSATTLTNNLNGHGTFSRPTTLILFKFCVAVFCSITGMLYTFPGLRFGQLHKNLLDRSCNKNLHLIAYNFNYLLPLFVICLWVKPISRAIITGPKGFFISLNDKNFEIFRIYCVVLANISRFFLLPRYITIFLESVDDRITRIKRRGGTTTNREIQMTVSAIFNYVNIVVIQYILPILMCLFTAMIYKTLGGHSWLPTFAGKTEAFNETISITNATNVFLAPDIDSFSISHRNISGSNLSESSATMVESVATMVNLNDFKKIFTPELFKGILGFATWWFHFSWFCSSTTGLIYHTYFLA